MPEDKDKDNKNPDSGEEGTKWPPDFDSYSDEENIEEVISKKPDKKEDKVSDDKPSFFTAAAGFGEDDSEETANTEEEESFPWLQEEEAEEAPTQAPISSESDDDMSVLFPGTEPVREEKIESEPEEESESASFLTSFLEEEPEAPVEEEVPLQEESLEEESFTPEDTGASILSGFGDPVTGETEESKDEAEDFSELASPKSDGNPYRAYASYDYVDTALFDDDGEEKAGLKLSKPLLIFIIILMLVGGYLGYQKITAGRYNFTKRTRKRPAREPRKIIEVAEEKLPLWAVTQQKKKESGADSKVILAALENSGRDNPFAIPAKIIALLRQDLEAQIAKEVPPEIFKRNAYRAQLVGVVSSAKQVLALVNLRIADFDITEGMTKVKIIDTATKSMNRTKDEPLELIVQDTIGPWEITEIRDGRDGSEARVFIKRGEETEELRIGVPVDLGIYDENGELAVFKESEGT